MVEHRSEKPGVDSSILSLGIFHLYGSPSLIRRGFPFLTVKVRYALVIALGPKKDLY